MNILLTGASKGIGRETLFELLSAGAYVIAGIRGGPSRFTELFSKDLRIIQAIKENRVLGVELDMAQSSTFPKLLQELKSKGIHQIHGLIQNAGCGVYLPAEAHHENQLRIVLETNLTGPILLTQTLLPLLRAGKSTMRPKIIFVTSILGRVSIPFYSSYCASKFGLEGYAESLRQEIGKEGIDVAVVEPGAFRTEFNSTAIEQSRLDHTRLMNLSPSTRNAIQKFHQLQANSKTSFRKRDPRVVGILLRKLALAGRLYRFRYPVGIDAWIITLAEKIIPHPIRVFLFDLIFRRIA